MEHLDIHLWLKHNAIKAIKARGLRSILFYWILAAISPTLDMTF